MKNLFLTLLVAVVALVSCDNTKTANTTAEGEAAQTEVIGGGDLAYVRVDYVLAESEIYKTEGVALQEKYQKGLITTADAQKQQQSIEKRVNNFQTSTQKEAQTLDEENYVFQNRTTDLIMRAIKEVNADRKSKMVVNATSLLDAAESLDISDTVLAKVNELYQKEKNEKPAETTATQKK